MENWQFIDDWNGKTPTSLIAQVNELSEQITELRNDVKEVSKLVSALHNQISKFIAFTTLRQQNLHIRQRIPVPFYPCKSSVNLD
jgi:hypothetical protein